MLIVDSHLDLGSNALYWNRDLTLDVTEVRAREAGMTGKGRGNNTVSLPEMRRGRVAVAVATLLARTGGSPATGIPKYSAPSIAYGMSQGQLAYYRALEELGEVRILRSAADLRSHWSEWRSWDAEAGDVEPRAARVPDAAPESNTPPLGLIVAMEGADAVVHPRQIPSWWNAGLRVLSMTHYQESPYAHGTGSEGGLKAPARELLEQMQQVGMTLDLTHLTDASFWEALDVWQGPVIASHNNCRSLVAGQRQMSNEQLEAIIERGGVVGCALDAWMLYPGWVRGETSPEVVGLEALVDHIVHICELAGNSRHAAIGSDLDGGYGNEQTPRDLDTIADLQKLPEMLQARGFGDEDLAAVMHGNLIEFFGRSLPTDDDPA